MQDESHQRIYGAISRTSIEAARQSWLRESMLWGCTGQQISVQP